VIAAPDTYAYFGANYDAPKVCVVQMQSAQLNDPADHAAAWCGMGTPRLWLQGGIEITFGDTQPHAYIHYVAGRVRSGREGSHDPPPRHRPLEGRGRRSSARLDAGEAARDVDAGADGQRAGRLHNRRSDREGHT
jgi:hypothetical protein